MTVADTEYTKFILLLLGDLLFLSVASKQTFSCSSKGDAKTNKNDSCYLHQR